MKKILMAVTCSLAIMASLVSCNKPGGEEVEKTKLPTPANLTIVKQTATSFTIQWDVVADAAGYVYTVDGGAEEKVVENQVTVKDLTTGKHTFTVYAKCQLNDEKYENSDAASIEVTLEEGGSSDDPYVGTYTATFDTYYSRVPDPDAGEGYYKEERGTDPFECEITITAAEEPDMYYVTGFSAFADKDGNKLPALAAIVEGYFCIMTGGIVADLGNGIYGAFTFFCSVDGQTGYYLTSGGEFAPACIVEFKGDNATLSMMDGELQDGKTYEGEHIELMTCDAAGEITGLAEVEVQLPWGDAEWSKKSSSAAQYSFRGFKTQFQPRFSVENLKAVKF